MSDKKRLTGDAALWAAISVPQRPKLNLDLSRHDVRGDGGQFAPKETATAPVKPAPLNGSIKHPLDGRVLMLKRSGRFFTTALIAMSFGIKLSKRQESEPGSTYVPLTGKQATKILAAVESQCMGLEDAPDPNKPASALTKAEREGRVSSTGPRSGFGVPMKQLKSGGWVQSNSNTDMPSVILTPTETSPWEWIEQGTQKLSQLSKDILKGIN